MDSSQLNKEVYKKSSLIFLSKLFISLSRVLTTFLFAHQLAQTNYGAYQNFWVQSSTIFALSGLSLATFVLTYTPERLLDMWRKLKAKNFVFAILLVGISATLFAMLQAKSGLAFSISFVFLVTNTLSIVLDSFLIVFKKIKILLLINFVYFLLFLAAHYYVLSLPEFNFNLLVLLLLGLTGLKSTIGILILGKCKNTVYAAGDGEGNNYRKLWRHLYFFDIFQIGMSFSDKFIVSVLLTEAESAVYQNATYVVPLLSILFSAVSSAVLIQLSQSGADMNRQTLILRNSGKLFAAIAIPVFFFFQFFGAEFIITAFSDKYLASIPIFRMSLLIIPLYVFNWTIFLQKQEQGKIINTGLLVDLISLLLLVYPLYRLLGLKGIPLSFALATMVQACYYMWHHSKILKRPIAAILPLKDWGIKAFLFAGLSFALHYITVNTLGLAPFVAMGISLMFIGLLSVYLLKRELKSSMIN